MADSHCYQPESLMAAIGDDRTSGAGVIMLQSLNAHGMAPAVTDLIEQGASGFNTTIAILSQLPKAETAERVDRSIAYRMKSARFPAFKDLRGLEPVASKINEAVGRCCTTASSSIVLTMQYVQAVLVLE